MALFQRLDSKKAQKDENLDFCKKPEKMKTYTKPY